MTWVMIEAIKKHISADRPTSTSAIKSIQRDVDCDDFEFIQLLQLLENDGYIRVQWSNNQVKRIQVSSTFPR